MYQKSPWKETGKDIKAILGINYKTKKDIKKKDQPPLKKREVKI